MNTREQHICHSWHVAADTAIVAGRQARKRAMTCSPTHTPAPQRSYKWSEVLSADAFAAFEEVGLADEAAVKATGRRYAGTVLALGGSVPPSKVYEMFRGRGPSTKALLRHAGLA